LDIEKGKPGHFQRENACNAWFSHYLLIYNDIHVLRHAVGPPTNYPVFFSRVLADPL
jgi:hypothetical protein